MSFYTFYLNCVFSCRPFTLRVFSLLFFAVVRVLMSAQTPIDFFSLTDFDAFLYCLVRFCDKCDTNQKEPTKLVFDYRENWHKTHTHTARDKSSMTHILISKLDDLKWENFRLSENRKKDRERASRANSHTENY